MLLNDERKPRSLGERKKQDEISRVMEVIAKGNKWPKDHDAYYRVAEHMRNMSYAAICDLHMLIIGQK